MRVNDKRVEYSPPEQEMIAMSVSCAQHPHSLLNTYVTLYTYVPGQALDSAPWFLFALLMQKIYLYIYIFIYVYVCMIK